MRLIDTFIVQYFGKYSQIGHATSTCGSIIELKPTLFIISL